MMCKGEAREDDASKLDRNVTLVRALSSDEQDQLLNQLERKCIQTPVGTPGKDLLFIAGSIPKDDLEIMRKAVDEDCAQIDYDSW